jgi:hypothetical protein
METVSVDWKQYHFMYCGRRIIRDILKKPLAQERRDEGI